jgi:putative membrane protein
MAVERPDGGDPGRRGPKSDGNLERTLLAGDRTLLAWYRTAFAANALAVGIGKIVPEVANRASPFYEAIGVLFALMGVFAVLVGVWQYVAFRGSTGAPPSPWVQKRFIVGFGVLTAGLSLGTAVLIPMTF